ncbi:MAG: DDE-type integrase/transposase/recombinase [Desulfomonilaceae bacterium]
MYTLEVEIQAAHRRARKTYGSERLREDLSDHGLKIGLHWIKAIRRKLGLWCIQKRRFRVTTDSSHGLGVADNLLRQSFEATAPGQIWMTDITYIWTDEGWLYLAGHKDLYTRAIVGYAMGSRITKSLVAKSLLHAVSMKRPEKGLIHFRTRAEAIKTIMEYIAVFYDRQGKQKKLGYLSPAPFERQYYEQQKAA